MANSRREDPDYADANRDSVERVVRGLGPDDAQPNDGAGARIVFNIACAHVPSFCTASFSGEKNPYKNAYDRDKAGGRRRRVDQAIERAIGDPALAAESIYFGAVETSGSGIRFYGDLCLVLREKPAFESATTRHYILDRNSYDVLRDPVAQLVRNSANPTDEMIVHLQGWLSDWETELIRRATEKVEQLLPEMQRRWTSGQIAGAILQDEDYIEVLYPHSFGTGDLLEVRINAADAAAEAEIGLRESNGEAPAAHELEWRKQRREAKRALVNAGVVMRIVVTLGRMRS